ncbi:hypothetical protein GGI19_000201 [Coemansia pectinata]|uniref:Uncharacterized protein n=1 Tax=Coemansia pectinata TaxID=1052879 RepID=A0A9W8H041_9FUNG|nr:hypothetical protein GGI19_000201 [Coemansia pectinata]
MVVNHVSHRGSQIFAESKSLLMPLLWVCRNFRAVVYSQHSGSFYVGLNRRLDKLSTTWTASSDFYVYSDYPQYHFARKLIIHLDEHSVYSGKMLEMMLEKSYDAGAFPMVRSMELHFSTLSDPEERKAIVLPLSDIPDIEANVDAFLQHAKLVAPKAKDIKVSGLFGHESTPTIPYRYTQNLLAQLFMLTYRIGFNDRYWTMPFDLPVNDIRNMVHINYQYYNNMGPIASLARLCASTLESLAIKGGEFEDISGLIRNDDGTFATYPWLRTLRLEDKDVFHRPSQLVFKGAVPFPNLRYLHITGRYPFGDDAPFRGNATKLQSLQLILSPPLVDILRVYKSFTPTSHPNLQHVKITRSIGLIRKFFDNDFASYTRLVLQIGPGAAVREFGQFSSYLDHRRHTTLLFRDYACIQALALPDTYMSLWEVLSLIKSLPLLTYLHTMEAHIHPLPSGLTASKLPAYVLTNYDSTSNRLQYWHLSSNMAFKVEVCAMCLLLLALVCPNFSYMTHRDLKPKKVLEKMMARSPLRALRALDPLGALRALDPIGALRSLRSDWKRFVLILALGQILSLCITSTSVLSNKLAERQTVTTPNFQSFLVYALLLIVYMPLTLVRLGPRKVWLNIKKRYYWYIFMALVDVEGNFFVIKAFSYTSLLSCMLLDTWTLPCVMVLAFFLMRARYKWTHILSVLICLGGMGLLIKGDMDAGKNYLATDAARGDIFMLIGATCYALSNITEEFIVRHRPQYETVAWLGFFGMVINGVQMAIIEHDRLKQMTWTKEIVGFTIGFDLVMFVLYSIAPFLFRLSSATFYNLSILTSDFYGLIFAKYMFHNPITPIYAGAFVMIVVGLLVYYIIPQAIPEHMARVYGFRTPIPGDLVLNQGAEVATVPNSSSDDDNRSVAGSGAFDPDSKARVQDVSALA